MPLYKQAEEEMEQIWTEPEVELLSANLAHLMSCIKKSAWLLSNCFTIHIS